MLRRSSVLPTVLLILATLAAAATADPLFDARRDFYCGDWPRDVTIGDFNGDGHQDLVVPLRDDEEAAVLLGNGDGTFQEAVTYETAADSWDAESPYSAAVGRINADEHDDFVVANWGSDNIGWLLGIGDGTFAEADTILVGGGPNCVILADFNEDTLLDAATANWFQDNVTILLGDGAGDFTYPAVPQYDAGINPYTVAVGDFNEDDDLDLVTANFADDDVSILLGNGDGTFDPAIDYPTVGEAPHDIAIADFDHDDHQDLVVPTRDTDDVSVLFGNGSGTFQPAVNYATGDRPYSVIAGDFDGDDNPDFATACRYDHIIHVFLGDGARGFAAGVPYVVDEEPYSIAVGDFDEDDNEDLAVACREGEGVSILLGRGDGTFRDTPRLDSYNNPYGLVLGYFDADPDLDLAAACTRQDTHKVQIFLGQGDGGFELFTEYPAGDFPTGMAGGLFNGDAHLDLITVDVNDRQTTVLLGNGDGTFSAGTSFDCGYPSAIVTADLDGRDDTDLVVSNGGVREVSTFLGNGDGTFTPAGTYSTGGDPGITAYRPGVGDFNGDDDLDLAVPMGSYDSGRLAILLGNGGGSFGAPDVLDTGGNGSGHASVGHFNPGDDLDVVVPNYNTGDVSVFLGNGDGSFQTPFQVPVGVVPLDTEVHDFNGDGFDDVAVSTSNDGNLVLLYGNGDATFQSADAYAGQDGAHDVVHGDLDGDGDEDIVMSNTSSEDISIFINLSAETPVEGSFYAVATGDGDVLLRWVVSSLADIRGFRVYRSTSPDGPFDLLTDDELPPTSIGEFVDDTVWPETTFWYQLRVVLTDGSEDTVGHTLASATTGGTLGLALSRPAPNPTASECACTVDIPGHAGPMVLAVYNARGQRVSTLIEGPLARGRHPVVWDGTDGAGRRVASGVYFLKLDGGGVQVSEKVLVLR